MIRRPFRLLGPSKVRLRPGLHSTSNSTLSNRRNASPFAPLCYACYSSIEWRANGRYVCLPMFIRALVSVATTAVVSSSWRPAMSYGYGLRVKLLFPSCLKHMTCYSALVKSRSPLKACLHVFSLFPVSLSYAFLQV